MIGIIQFAFVLEFLNTLFLVQLNKFKSTDIKTCAVFACMCGCVSMEYGFF